jgi:hypothetical protein
MTLLPQSPNRPTTTTQQDGSTKQTGGFIQSTTPVANMFQGLQTQFNSILNQPDAFSPLYEQLMELSKTQEKNAIASATTQSAREKQQEQQSQNQYESGLQTAGIQSGTARYAPEFQLGLIKQAQNASLGRMQMIDQAEKLAIAKAQQARMEGDVKTLQLQIQNYNELRKEKLRAIERVQELQWDEYKFKTQMEFDKQKFNQQMALNWAQENRIAKEAADTPDKENFYDNAFYSIEQKGGKITGAQFNILMEQGLASGLKRDDIIQSFAPYFNDIKRDKKLREEYGITEVEFKNIFKK